MEYFRSFSRQAHRYILVVMLAGNIILIGLALGLTHFTALPILAVLAICVVTGLLLTYFAAKTLGNYLLSPLQAISQAILHLSPTEQGVAAPNLKELRVGYELITSLAAQVYQLVNIAEHAVAEGRLVSSDINNNFIAQNLPLPMLVLDPEELIVFANKAAADYIGLSVQDLIGKNVYMVLDMAFPSESTFDAWLKHTKASSATATAAWERVKLGVSDYHPERLFDLAAYYNRDNPNKMETMLIMFDHSKRS
jgi:PAS domain-containing protein